MDEIDARIRALEGRVDGMGWFLIYSVSLFVAALTFVAARDAGLKSWWQFGSAAAAYLIAHTGGGLLIFGRSRIA